jgi:hypothetical protein
LEPRPKAYDFAQELSRDATFRMILPKVLQVAGIELELHGSTVS